MSGHYFATAGKVFGLCLVGWLGGQPAARAQAQHPDEPARPTTQRPRPVAKTAAVSGASTNPNARVDDNLQQLYQESANLRRSAPGSVGQALRASHPELKFSKSQADPAVLVRITAVDVNALLPGLQSRGFVVAAARPDLHFVEGLLPVSQLRLDGQGAAALATQGLLGIVSSYQPQQHVGRVTSQADYVLETDRTRATRPANVSGAGVKVGVLSDSFNALNTAAAGVASGDLPAAGVQVLNESTGEDEGRGMSELIHDLAPGSPLAFSTAHGGEGAFAQHIIDLANPAKGNCQVIVDDVSYFTEPYFQDGVIAQAINQVVTQRGVNYFSSAGNNGDQGYSNAAPQFVLDAATQKQLLNFDVTGATTSLSQTVTVPVPSASDNGTFSPFLQWSDPFYTTNGVKTNLDLFLVSMKNGVPADTVARSASNNILTQYPVEGFQFTNKASLGTTTFKLIIVLRSGLVPTRVKYVVFNNGVPNRVAAGPGTGGGGIVGHPLAALAFAVAAVPYYNQRTPESFTSKGGALPILFGPTGAVLATPATRQKPDIASVDGTDTSFFGSGDLDGTGFPNFFGTSAAAPHAAAVAALMRSADPTLTAAQVYTRLTASARLIGTAATDPFTGPGLLDAFSAVYGAVAPATLPYVEDLEKTALPVSWVVSNTRAGRVQVSGVGGPASGKYHLLLEAALRFTATNAVQSLDEATCYLNNVSSSSLQLSFRQRKFASETDEQMPASFTGSSLTDGVALSVDGGTTWYRLVDLTGPNATTAYQTNTVSLSQFAAANNLTLGTDVRVKFQRYGSGGAASGVNGRAFDDIAFTTATSPAPVALFNASQATTGCPGLQVQYADTSLFKPTAYAWTFPGGTPATSTLRNPLVTYSTPGHYAVTLSVSNAAGTAMRADTGYVFVYGRAPQVTATSSKLSICQGSAVTFASAAQYCPTSYAWSFPGGTPASSTSASPGAVTYAAAGTYTATLVVSNAYGSSTSRFIVDVDGQAIPFAETFDNSPTLPRGWSLVTPSTFSWTLVDNIPGRNGVASRALQAPFADDDQVGEYPAVYTPALNLAGVASPKLRFDLAYGPFASVAGAVPTDVDSLTVRVVDACSGAVLGTPYSKGTLNGLPTSASTPNYFVPASAADWRQELVDLTPYAGQRVVLQFRGYNGFGNSLFIDNVQVGNALLALATAANAVGLEAWPVPTPHGEALNLRLPAYTGLVDLRLLDNLGRVVWQQQVAQTGAALERTLSLPFAPGLYNLLYQPAGSTPAARRIVVE